ncbi:potassium transport 2/3 [Artemisia annua]|uniref:Potassium transport 2/3 n=1 Tax=Artemisia annua TaxID=35608 RepID=A0A2U1KA65_ARTAN|nr:potassium transport 2/3 [Artemisia annua]
MAKVYYNSELLIIQALKIGGNPVAMNIVGKGISTQDHLLFLLLLFDAQTKNVFTLCWNRWSRNIKLRKLFCMMLHEQCKIHELEIFVYSALAYPFEAAFLKTSSRSLTKIYILDSIVDAFFLVDLVLTFFVGFFDPRTQLLIFDPKIYSALAYPFEAAFLKTSSRSLTKIYILDSIVDAFFLVDLVLTFFVGFFDPRTQLLIFDPKSIALRYLKTWFIPDLVSTLPFELCFYLLTRKHNLLFTVLGLLRLSRFRHVEEFFTR